MLARIRSTCHKSSWSVEVEFTDSKYQTLRIGDHHGFVMASLGESPDVDFPGNVGLIVFAPEKLAPDSSVCACI